jgi:hypothetical protein
VLNHLLTGAKKNLASGFSNQSKYICRIAAEHVKSRVSSQGSSPPYRWNGAFKEKSMSKLSQPLHGIRCTETDGWEVWSVALQYPLKCGSPVDAKRVAAALEVAFPRGARVDYSEADKAIQHYRASSPR